MKVRFVVVLRILICFVLIIGLLLVERMGIQYSVQKSEIDILPIADDIQNKPLADTKTCLYIMDSSDANSIHAEPQFTQILTDMRVPFEQIDVSTEEIPDFRDYETVLVGCMNLSPLGSKILDLSSYVYDGGAVMFGLPMEKETALDVISNKIGIDESSYDFYTLQDFKSAENFMLGYETIYKIEDAYDSSMKIAISDRCEVFATNADGNIPLVWRTSYGDGRFVVCNFGYCEKAYRGIYASAYSLLEDVCVYPIINASNFYLDDFPSPVPNGDSEYIMRDYGMGVAEFYSYVWWPDVLRIASKHDIPLTGVVIETYEDNTSENLKSNGSTSDFYYYGNMLLNRGGEIGYHGYNHQPLCGPDYIYAYDEGYSVWESYTAMYNAMTELTDFVGSLFPSSKACVYVPPSNILSDAGREMIVNDFPQIRCIASNYLPGENAYAQEFEVKEDGMIEAPRTISGCILDDYMMMTAFSELNMHYVSSHFMHPDDLLDVDRGAEMGWEVLKTRYNYYMDWLDQNVPYIRKVTGSGLAGSVQRYSNLTLHKTNDENGTTIDFDGFIDEAYCLVRVNNGSLADIEGAEATQLNDNLYLIRVDDSSIRINTDTEVAGNE